MAEIFNEIAPLQNNIENSLHDKVYFSVLRKHGYKLWQVVAGQKNGFNVLVLRNPKGDVIISIDGTDLWDYRQRHIELDTKQKEIAKLELINMLQDLTDDWGIILRKIPRQYKATETFVAQILSRYLMIKLFLLDIL